MSNESTDNQKKEERGIMEGRRGEERGGEERRGEECLFIAVFPGNYVII